MKEATVNSLLREENGDRVIGVVAQSKADEESKVSRQSSYSVYVLHAHAFGPVLCSIDYCV